MFVSTFLGYFFLKLLHPYFIILFKKQLFIFKSSVTHLQESCCSRWYSILKTQTRTKVNLIQHHLTFRRFIRTTSNLLHNRVF